MKTSPKSKDLFKLSGVLLVIGLLASCSSPNNGGDDASAGDGERTLTTVGYGGAVDEAQFEAIGGPFADEYGVRVQPDSPLDYSKIKAQVDSGRVTWDVVKVEPYWAIQNCGDYLEPIDTSKISSLSDLPEEAILECGVPLDTFGFVMVYNNETFTDESPQGWADFFDTEKFPGKRGIWNFPTGMALEAALLADGVSVDELYPLDVDRALAKLDTIRDDLVFYDTGAIQTEQMESGEVAMSIAWSARMVDVVRNGAPFSPAWNDNFILYDTLVIVKGSEQVDIAHDYIDYATQAEPQTRFAELMPYAPANQQASPELDEFASMFDLNDPAVASESIMIDQQWWADNFDEVSTIWSQWSVS